MTPGEPRGHGCGPVGPLIEFDLFHMFTSWRLCQVHIVHSKGQARHIARRAHREHSSRHRVEGPGSRVQSPGSRVQEQSTQSIRSDDPSRTQAQRKRMVHTHTHTHTHTYTHTYTYIYISSNLHPSPNSRWLHHTALRYVLRAQGGAYMWWKGLNSVKTGSKRAKKTCLSIPNDPGSLLGKTRF